MSSEKLVLGLDYGSDSVRSVIIDTADGKEIASCVHNYTRWSQGLYCEPDNNQFRQHPLDYLEGLEIVVKGALSQAPAGTAEKIKGITVDTTGSTPIAVDESGTRKKPDRALKRKLKKIDEDLEFILMVNKPGFLNDEEEKRLSGIYRKKYLDSNGVEMPYLKDYEYENLSIRKGN